MDESTDSDNFGREFEPSEHKESNNWANDKLDEGDDDETPFTENMLKVGTGKHETDTNNWEWGGGAADVADGVGYETREFDPGKEDDHAEEHSDDVRICNDAFN